MQTSQAPLAERQHWPKLSVTLASARAPGWCQGCSCEKDVQRWEECDEWDKPTGVLVLLCKGCSKRLVDPHPRLYSLIDSFKPWPGAMDLCLACKHRDGLACDHPQLATNGGPGLVISFPKPAHAILCGRGCRHVSIYRGPPKSCAGREVVA